MIEVTESDKAAAKQHQHRFLTEGRSETELLWEAFATHRIEAAKAERDRLRDLSNADAAKIRDTLPERVQIPAGWFQRFATALADALEGEQHVD